MFPQAMAPFGRALLAYLEGGTQCDIIVRRDDGKGVALPARVFFRHESEFTLIEKTALQFCNGGILDVGAGAGLHSKVLLGRGFSVTAIDISREAVTVMEQQGMTDVHCVDIFKFSGGPFDTLLLMGHGIGMVETISGLERFLELAKRLLADGGQILLDSLDVRQTDDPDNLAYHEANRAAGRYIGEIRMRFEFGGVVGPFCGWLQVDPETLMHYAGSAGWNCEILHREPNGDYLARLTGWKRAR